MPSINDKYNLFGDRNDLCVLYVAGSGTRKKNIVKCEPSIYRPKEVQIVHKKGKSQKLHAHIFCNDNRPTKQKC